MYVLTFSRLLLDGCPLIAVHKARYYKREDGLALGPGPFVAALEYAASMTAEMVGKPQASFFTEALTDMGVPPQNTLMIGDVSQFVDPLFHLPVHLLFLSPLTLCLPFYFLLPLFLPHFLFSFVHSCISSFLLTFFSSLPPSFPSFLPYFLPSKFPHSPLL